jgi:hypothetical protein
MKISVYPYIWRIETTWRYFAPYPTIPTPELEVQLLAKAGEPPAWRNSWFSHVPLIGKAVVCAINAPRYATTLEQNADFIAADLEIGIDGSEWIGKAVGIIDARK